MKHIKLFENTNIDPFDDNWFENEEQEIKKYEIRYYEIAMLVYSLHQIMSNQNM